MPLCDISKPHPSLPNYPAPSSPRYLSPRTPQPNGHILNNNMLELRINEKLLCKRLRRAKKGAIRPVWHVTKLSLESLVIFRPLYKAPGIIRRKRALYEGNRRSIQTTIAIYVLTIFLVAPSSPCPIQITRVKAPFPYGKNIVSFLGRTSKAYADRQRAGQDKVGWGCCALGGLEYLPMRYELELLSAGVNLDRGIGVEPSEGPWEGDIFEWGELGESLEWRMAHCSGSIILNLERLVLNSAQYVLKNLCIHSCPFFWRSAVRGDVYMRNTSCHIDIYIPTVSNVSPVPVLVLKIPSSEEPEEIIQQKWLTKVETLNELKHYRGCGAVLVIMPVEQCFGAATNDGLRSSPAFEADIIARMFENESIALWR
ncbi:hypothetical protein DEU56DRAFT_905339 [Suillus clintonianus]|uniref:uncharacterized protein n=1 Tax=Suillus clintonianus TaxID=1904413 RepID=UPI001B85E847|nr:uncharacterized protein DEU56DRAFT_905339 [Suillus clintonianus]KAG2114832.1 hypothetical protein DEU56DRAFT_905339 [Suillus clintonianus]